MASATISPLISPEELSERLADASIRIADCRWYLGLPERGRSEYAAGHLPGAIFIDLETVLAGADGPGRHPLPTPATFAARLAALGIGDEHEVVAYDDVGGTIAARLWWMLDNLGHRNVAVLDGGLPAWRAAGLPITTDTPRYERGRLHLASEWHNVIDRAHLRTRGEPGWPPAGAPGYQSAPARADDAATEAGRVRNRRCPATIEREA